MICLSCLITVINRRLYLQNVLYMDTKHSIIRLSRKGKPKEKKNEFISPPRVNACLFFNFCITLTCPGYYKKESLVCSLIYVIVTEILILLSLVFLKMNIRGTLDICSRQKIFYHK